MAPAHNVDPLADFLEPCTLPGDARTCKKDRQVSVLSWTAVGHGLGLAAHIVIRGAWLLAEGDRFEACSRWGLVGVVAPWATMLAVQAGVCGFFGAARLRRACLFGCDPELCSVAVTTVICAVLPWLQVFASKQCQELQAEAEAVWELAAVAAVAWYCLCVPIRWQRLWIFPVMVWGSLVGLVSYASLLSVVASLKLVLLSAIFASLAAGARLLDRGVREQWRAGQHIENEQQVLTMAKGIWALAQQLSHSVVKLTDTFEIIGADKATDDFFGRSVEGEHVAGLMDYSDSQRFTTALSRASNSLTPQQLGVTLLQHHGPVHVAVVVVDLGAGHGLAGLARYAASFTLQPTMPSPQPASPASRTPSEGRDSSSTASALGKTSTRRSTVVSLLPLSSRSLASTLGMGEQSLASAADTTRPGIGGLAQFKRQVSQELPGAIADGNSTFDGGSTLNVLPEPRRTVMGRPTELNALAGWGREISCGSLVPSEISDAGPLGTESPKACFRGRPFDFVREISGASLAYSEFSEAVPMGPSCSRSSRPRGRQAQVAEAQVQTEPCLGKVDATVNTVASWDEEVLVCATCSKPPRPPGEVVPRGRSLPPSRSRQRRPSASRTPRSRSSSQGSAASGSSGSSGRQGAEEQSTLLTSVPTVADAAPACVALLQGHWLLCDVYPGNLLATDTRLRALRIEGCVALDASGRRSPLLFRGGDTYLLGGRLWVENNVLYRTDPTGQTLAFLGEKAVMEQLPPAATQPAPMLDGMWLLFNDHLGEVGMWLRALQIRGTVVVDAVRCKHELVEQGGVLHLQGGRVWLENCVLYRRGRSGMTLAFLRAETQEREQGNLT